LPGAVGVGIDASPAALAIARSNAKACGLAGRVLWVAGDWVKPIRGDYDIIVSNPPYIPSGALATLDLGVRGHDPIAALDGGPDGMAAYRLLIPAMADLLAPAGIACLEVGHGQAPFVAEMASHLGYATEICTDLAGIQRCITLKL
jgi:release factor glutamine methyltransferase